MKNIKEQIASKQQENDILYNKIIKYQKITHIVQMIQVYVLSGMVLYVLLSIAIGYVK